MIFHLIIFKRGHHLGGGKLIRTENPQFSKLSSTPRKLPPNTKSRRNSLLRRQGSSGSLPGFAHYSNSKLKEEAHDETTATPMPDRQDRLGK